jgi:hypothetical protein
MSDPADANANVDTSDQLHAADGVVKPDQLTDDKGMV